MKKSSSGADSQGGTPSRGPPSKSHDNPAPSHPTNNSCVSEEIRAMQTDRILRETFFRVLQIILVVYGASHIQHDLLQRYTDIPRYMAFLDRLTQRQLDDVYGSIVEHGMRHMHSHGRSPTPPSPSKDIPDAAPSENEPAFRTFKRETLKSLMHILHRRCVGRSPREPHRRWVCTRLGEMYLIDFDEPAEALQYFQITSELPGYHQVPELMFHLAIVYERLGNKELAIETLANVMQQSASVVEGSLPRHAASTLSDALDATDLLRRRRYLIQVCYASLHVARLLDENLDDFIAHDSSLFYRLFYHLRYFAWNTSLSNPCSTAVMASTWRLAASIHRQVYLAVHAPERVSWLTRFHEEPTTFIAFALDRLRAPQARSIVTEEELSKVMTRYIHRTSETTVPQHHRRGHTTLRRLTLRELIQVFQYSLCINTVIQDGEDVGATRRASLCATTEHAGSSRFSGSSREHRTWRSAWHCQVLHDVLAELHRVLKGLRTHARKQRTTTTSDGAAEQGSVDDFFPFPRFDAHARAWYHEVEAITHLLHAQCMLHHYQLARVYCAPSHSFEVHPTTGVVSRLLHSIPVAAMEQDAPFPRHFEMLPQCVAVTGQESSTRTRGVHPTPSSQDSDGDLFQQLQREFAAQFPSSAQEGAYQEYTNVASAPWTEKRPRTSHVVGNGTEAHECGAGDAHDSVSAEGSESPILFQPDPQWSAKLEAALDNCPFIKTLAGSSLVQCTMDTEGDPLYSVWIPLILSQQYQLGCEGNS